VNGRFLSVNGKIGGFPKKTNGAEGSSTPFVLMRDSLRHQRVKSGDGLACFLMNRSGA
jgi:hypothetical protein